METREKGEVKRTIGQKISMTETVICYHNYIAFHCLTRWLVVPVLIRGSLGKWKARFFLSTQAPWHVAPDGKDIRRIKGWGRGKYQEANTLLRWLWWHPGISGTIYCLLIHPMYMQQHITHAPTSSCYAHPLFHRSNSNSNLMTMTTMNFWCQT